jgi:hypothetical protein
MAARAAIGLCLGFLASGACAQAQDDPACAQYREPMAYNLCLARHGPKGNAVGTLHGGAHAGLAPDRTWYGGTGGRARTARVYGQKGAHGRVHMEFRVQ